MYKVGIDLSTRNIGIARMRDIPLTSNKTIIQEKIDYTLVQLPKWDFKLHCYQGINDIVNGIYNSGASQQEKIIVELSYFSKSSAVRFSLMIGALTQWFPNLKVTLVEKWQNNMLRFFGWKHIKDTHKGINYYICDGEQIIDIKKVSKKAFYKLVNEPNKDLPQDILDAYLVARFGDNDELDWI